MTRGESPMRIVDLAVALIVLIASAGVILMATAIIRKE
jgi:hypothetical protein